MDISSLRERKTPSELTVTELNSYIKNLFDNDRSLKAVSVRGEISNFTYHKTSGHLYFSLKDDGGQVKAVMFRSAAAALKFMPENGMKFIVRCSVSVYSPSGSYQLYVTSMQPDGIGALYLAYEQLKAKLESEGLFSEEFKVSIPKYPSKIGVITSPTGAAVRDIINITARRYPLADIYLYPSLVQGEGASSNLTKGIDYFDKSNLVDVIIIGRGGGSIEDLWAFNDEALAIRIFACRIPVISAVGHETDFTICDFVSDMRAPTPSAAAELAVPDARELLMRLSDTSDMLKMSLERMVERRAERLEYLKKAAIVSFPDKFFDGYDSYLEKMRSDITNYEREIISECDSSVRAIAAKLQALSPLSVLSRGYSVVSSAGKVVKQINDVEVSDMLTVRVTDGEIKAEVKERLESK
jgi:exodeoxyribonuclease VII large subunit